MVGGSMGGTESLSPGLRMASELHFTHVEADLQQLKRRKRGEQVHRDGRADRADGIGSDDLGSGADTSPRWCGTSGAESRRGREDGVDDGRWMCLPREGRARTGA